VGRLAPYLPAGIVGVDCWGVPHGRPPLLVLLANTSLGSAQGILGDGSLSHRQPSQQPQGQGHLAHRNPHLVVQGMSGGQGPWPQPVGGGPVLVGRQIRVFPAHLAATASAAADPHPVLGYFGLGSGW
jgi:hypothetical protein